MRRTIKQNSETRPFGPVSLLARQPPRGVRWLSRSSVFLDRTATSATSDQLRIMLGHRRRDLIVYLFTNILA